MPKAKINERIAKFTGVVELRAKKIIDIRNESWAPIIEGNETQRGRDFLTKKRAGVTRSIDW